MTIQVNTLKINASVSGNEPVRKSSPEIRMAPTPAAGDDKKDELIEQCVERVLDILRRELKP